MSNKKYYRKYQKYRYRYRDLLQTGNANRGVDPETGEIFVLHLSTRGKEGKDSQFARLPVENLTRGLWFSEINNGTGRIKLQLFSGTTSASPDIGHFWSTNPFVALRFAIGFRIGDTKMEESALLAMPHSGQSISSTSTPSLAMPKLKSAPTIRPGHTLMDGHLLVGRFHDFRGAESTITSYQRETGDGRETYSYLKKRCPTTKSVIVVPFNQDQIVFCDAREWLDTKPVIHPVSHNVLVDVILNQPDIKDKSHSFVNLLSDIEPDKLKWRRAFLDPNWWMDQKLRVV